MRKPLLMLLSGAALSAAASIGAIALSSHPQSVSAAEESTVATVYFSYGTHWKLNDGAKIYAHAWKDGGTASTTWPGVEITTVTGATNFQQWGSIYKFEVDTSLYDRIVFDCVGAYYSTPGDANNDTTQTCNLTVVPGAHYTAWDNKDTDGNLITTGSVSNGLAAAFVYEADTAIRAVEAADGVLAGSLCGLSKTEASRLYGLYQTAAADASAASAVASSTLYTYSSASGQECQDWSYSDIAAQLGALSGLNKSSSSSRLFLSDSSSELPVAILSCGALAVLGVASYFLLKKKRAE